MVKRLYGTVNSVEVSFSYFPDRDIWEVAVPKNDSGRYVVALWAEDFAGNSSYFATILLEINPDIIGFRFKVIDYNLQLSKKEVCKVMESIGFKGLWGFDEDEVT